ncbi:MAG: zinc ABC transporter substrate-binding protein [Planctomycetes bacterium]|nr:zinc ABC transporter substrate-binding protein [Planctomycetota bacterium]
MRRTAFAVLFAFLAALPLATAQDRVVVVTTTETLRSLAQEVGGDRVEAISLSRGIEDPHFIIPTPTLMLKVNDADLFVETGMQLEPWVERVLDGARNSKVRRGAEGHLDAYEGVERLEVPASLTRAEGDIHPYGNPHVWLDPLNGKILAANIEKGLERVDPAGAETYRARLADFQRRIDEAFFGRDLIDLVGIEYLERLQRSGGLLQFLEENEMDGTQLADLLGGWRKSMLPVRGKKFVSYHTTWVYLAAAFDFEVVETLEPKPGISPTPSHLARVREAISSHGVRAIFDAPYYDLGKARTVAEETGISAFQIPSGVGGDEAATDYFRLFDRIAVLLAGAAGG